MSYRRISLEEFVVLDMLEDQENVVPINVLLTYIPSIFSDVMDTEKLKRMILDDKASFVVDYVEGEVYIEPSEDYKYFDLHQLAIDEGAPQKVHKQTIEDKFNKAHNKSLDELYAEKKLDVTKYLDKVPMKIEKPSDAYKTTEEPTISSVLRKKMDDNPDSFI